MIKINLLRGAETPSAAAEASGPAAPVAYLVKVFLVSLLVSFAPVGFFYWYWNGQIGKLNKDLEAQRKEAARLAVIQAENQRYLQQLRELEGRIQTIQMLQNRRVGPVGLLNALGDTVNSTKGLYLLTASAESDRLVIQGQSDSVESIAYFIAALKRSGTFEDVQLRQYFQDDQYNRMSFKFNLDCVYQPPGGVAPAAPTGVAPSAAAPRPAKM